MFNQLLHKKVFLNFEGNIETHLKLILNNNRIGFYKYYIDNPNNITIITSLHTNKEFRNLGYCTNIIKLIENESIKQNIYTIKLGINNSNLINYYFKLGYIIENNLFDFYILSKKL